MFNSIYTNKGLTLIEVLIALFLTSVGVLALLSLQPSAWNLTGRSDRLGRAGGILHQELEVNEALLMNPNYPNPCIATNPLVTTRNVNASGQSTPQPGDATFGVQTTIRDNVTNWSVRVWVTWPGNANGISETRTVIRQEPFRF
jgi:prepilin-type N-terminal cleavage/methylation domain-containing protein